jgi:hypothetical protein
MESRTPLKYNFPILIEEEEHDFEIIYHQDIL